MCERKSRVKWGRLVSTGSIVDAEQQENSPWFRSSPDGCSYRINPGYKAERTAILDNGKHVLVCCEIIKPQLAPLFKCSCKEKEVEIVATTPTRAANSFLHKIGVSTTKHWSGPDFFGFLRKDVFKRLAVNLERNAVHAVLSDINISEQPAVHAGGQLLIALENNGTGSDPEAELPDDNNYCNTTIQTRQEICTETICSEQQENADGIDFVNIALKEGKTINWLGVKTIGLDSYGLGPKDKLKWSYKHNNISIQLKPGYEAHQLVIAQGLAYKVSCKIRSGSNGCGPIFSCEVFKGSEIVYTTSETKPTRATKNVFKFLKLDSYKKNLSGYTFFGLTRDEVLKLFVSETGNRQKKRTRDQQTSTDNDSLPAKRKPLSDLQYPLLDSLQKTKTRNAGPTSTLKGKSKKQRNELVHEAVKFTSFNDVKSYIQYLCQNDPDLVASAIEESELCNDILCKLTKPSPRIISIHDSAELLLGRTSLTQREYIAAKKVLVNGNVHLAKYEDVVKYSAELDIGSVILHACDYHDQNEAPEKLDCMCATTDFVDTMQRIVSNRLLFSKFDFPSVEQQDRLFKHLKSERPELYKSLDPKKRTLYLRETGDNFRAGARQPTEQMSFSLLNITELINSPNGQFLSAIWRGPESRQFITAHMKVHYKDATDAVQKGLTLLMEDGSKETFNVVIVFVADLGHLKETLGKCLCTSQYGCYWCKKKITDWDKSNPTTSSPQTIKEMIDWGEKAEKELGVEPKKGTSAYTAFQQSHFGQTVRHI